MTAPSVHMLSSAAFNGTALVDPQSATIDESGTPQEYITADKSDVQLVGVDRIAATVSVVCLGYHDSLEVGDVGAAAVGPPAHGGLDLVLKPRAEGKGVQASPLNKTWTRAVILSKSGGPVIEGNPTYTITFRCYNPT